MDARIKNIVAGFRLEIENTSWPTASVRISVLEAIVRWAEETEMRELQSKAEGQVQVLKFLAARMPDRDTKKDHINPCCRFNINEVLRTFPLERVPKLRR